MSLKWPRYIDNCLNIIKNFIWAKYEHKSWRVHLYRRRWKLQEHKYMCLHYLCMYLYCYVQKKINPLALNFATVHGLYFYSPIRWKEQRLHLVCISKYCRTWDKSYLCLGTVKSARTSFLRLDFVFIFIQKSIAAWKKSKTGFSTLKKPKPLNDTK